MKNNIEKIYDLEIHRYENNKTLYILLSYGIDKKSICITIDLAKEYDICEYLYRFNDYKIEDALSGILNNKLAYVITKELKVHGYLIKELNHKQIKNIDDLIHNFNLFMIKFLD